MLSIILPTFNESKNLPELIARLAKVVSVDHEIIVVDDDSPDETWRTAEELSKKNKHLRVLRRIGRRGLSSAVTEGFSMAKGNVFLVMDSDLQHDPALVMKLHDMIDNGADIAVASRYMKGGSVGEWVKGRRWLSTFATFLAKKLPPVEVSDPMSGFFAIRKSAYLPIAAKLHPRGFKILLEILSCLPRSTKVGEVPLKFAMRVHGESKLNLRVNLQFLLQLLTIVGRRVLGARRAWIAAFIVLCIATAIPLSVRALSLGRIYRFPALRASVQRTLESVAAENGWLMSDIALTNVRWESIDILHRRHARGADTVRCYRILQAGTALEPCAD